MAVLSDTKLSNTNLFEFDQALSNVRSDEFAQALDQIPFVTSKKTSLAIDRSQDAHETIIATLSSALDPCERAFAATSLGYLNDIKVIPALEMAILTPGENVYVLEAALRSLASYGESAKFSASSVARLLYHESAIVRVAAAKALSSFNLEADANVMAVGGALTDPILGVRREVGKILKDLPGEKLTDLVPRAVHLLEVGEGDRELVACLMKIIERGARDNADGARAIRNRLHDSDGSIKLQAIDSIAKLGPCAMIAGDDLISIASNPLEGVLFRKEALLSLRVLKYFDNDSLMNLGRVIEEEILENNPQKIKEHIALKREVMALLGDYGPKAVKAAPYLRHALKSDDAALILAAAEALTKLEAYEIMIDSLNSSDVLVMQAITEAIRGLVHKLKANKRAKLIALLKLKLGWIKTPRLVDSINSLLQALETAEMMRDEFVEQPSKIGQLEAANYVQ